MNCGALSKKSASVIGRTRGVQRLGRAIVQADADRRSVKIACLHFGGHPSYDVRLDLPFLAAQDERGAVALQEALD